MDVSSALDLQFLDLSEVDEYEKNRVLSSLYSNRQGDDFPWFIGDEKAAFTGSKKRLKKTINQPCDTLAPDQNGYPQFDNQTLTTIDPISGLPVAITNPYFNPSPYLPPIVSVPLHPKNFAPPPAPVSSIYPNFVGKGQIYYGVPPVQPIFLNQADNYYGNGPNFIQNEVIVQQSSDLEIPVNGEPDTQNTTTKDNKMPEEEEEDTNKSSNAKPNPWGGNKSWASLFASKTAPVAGPTINGTVGPMNTDTVKHDSIRDDANCPIKNPKKSRFIDPDCYRMGEFLADYKVDGRAVSLQPRGLINQSNYCYINSILQALLACPPMYNLLSGLAKNISSNEKRKPTPVIDGICKFVKEFSQMPANMRVTGRRSDPKNQSKKDQGVIINTDMPFEPAWIYRMLNGIRTDLIEGRQEDAEEFLCCLLNNLNDEMLDLIKLIKGEDQSEVTQTNRTGEEDEKAAAEWQVMGSKNRGSVLRKTVLERTPITDIFGGSLKSRIHRAGDQDTENTQPFFTLQLNIEKVKTVREALDALITKNQLEGVTSSKTNEEVEAWQQVMLEELPIILVLHLKCFDFKLDGCTKIVKALEFPIDLKIDSKLLSSKNATAKEKQYKLFAVVYHDGKEATKGHYVTDAFHVGYSSWLRYDDASVKPVMEEQVLKPQGTRVPYLLFYRRSDTIRR